MASTTTALLRGTGSGKDIAGGKQREGESVIDADGEAVGEMTGTRRDRRWLVRWRGTLPYLLWPPAPEGPIHGHTNTSLCLLGGFELGEPCQETGSGWVAIPQASPPKTPSPVSWCSPPPDSGSSSSLGPATQVEKSSPCYQTQSAVSP